ncbi:fructosamine kinase family protein [Haloferula sp.]|uniref:fructosamine kinase family protein n=1 Tax=Haloferula sp. TaxID=2497595 RepID=UPI003C74F3E4
MSSTLPIREIAQLLPSTPLVDPIAVAGGCIHDSWHWGPYFIKTNTDSELGTLQSEATCLQAIAASGAIRVPEFIALGTAGSTSFLALEHLHLVPLGNESLLGEQLAELHAQTADNFGFPTDNHIGTTRQENAWHESWSTFFRDRRISPLLELLRAKEIVFPKSQSLLDRLDDLLPPVPKPALLHGDLWAGNKAFLTDGTPVVFDPACYYGHHICDLAMTRLFGGFGARFYDAYRSCSEIGDASLHEIYNLYHILNHALLFGGGYIGQADELIRRFAKA